MANVNAAANRLGSNAKTLTQCAGSPEKLGAASKATAAEAVAVTSAARTVASFCEQRTASAVLNKAKALNQSTIKLMDACGATAANPGESGAQTMLLTAAKAVAQAAKALAACQKTMDDAKAA